MIASKADIIAHESLGYSHLVYRGESYFVNLDSENSRLKFKSYLEKETGKEWDIAELERYVFYRKDMYTLVRGRLELNASFTGKVEIPINTVSCAFMFMHKSLEGVNFSDFDTSGIENMSYMFHNCNFPNGFSLGDRFDTSKVKDMGSMFNMAKFNEGFSLGSKFNTSSVEDMQCMFSNVKFDKDFSLGDKFNTAKVEEMGGMFYECTFPEGFSLGNMFDTFKVKDMGSMFSKCYLPAGFSLGDRFDTSSVEDMSFMFRECTFPAGFSLGDRFVTSSVKDMSFMFNNTQFNEDFSLARDFTIYEKSEYMFLNAKLPSRVTERLGSEITAEEIIELLKSDIVTKADFF